MNPLLILLLAGGAWYWYNGKRAVSSITCRLRGVTVKMKGLAPVFTFKVGVQNPTSVSVTLQSIVGDVYRGNDFLASVTYFGTKQIAPNMETLIDVVVEPSILTAAKAMLTIIQTKGKALKGQKLQFKGSLNINSVNVPFVSTYAI